MRILVLSLFAVAISMIGTTNAFLPGIDVELVNTGCLVTLSFNRRVNVDTTQRINFVISGDGVGYRGSVLMLPSVTFEEVDYQAAVTVPTTLKVDMVMATASGRKTETQEIDIPRCADVTHDPHILTFDGRRYTYQGLCWHTIVKDCSGKPPRFEVLGKFEPRDPLDREIRSRTTDVTVIVGGQVIEMDTHNNVKVNGRPAESTFELVGGKMHVAVDNTKDRYTVVSVKDTIAVTWNGAEHGLNTAVEGG
ncbi:uncharacterized protein [Ptychodera flava]|uniref:uncharacterized protein n=1 Tax=Ptychodera flava TaxID=63121 RepID=UPI00396A33B8